MDRLVGDISLVWRVPAAGLAIYLTIILLTRMNGLRSFSTMSGFDLAITVATGSLVASTTLRTVPLVHGVLGLASCSFSNGSSPTSGGATVSTRSWTTGRSC